MISVFIILFFILVCVGWFLRKRTSIFETNTSGTRSRFKPKPLIPIVVTLILGFILAAINPYTYERVDAGNVGVKVNLTGNDRGVSDVNYATGWVTYNVWFEELYQFPTFQQHIEYDKQQVILKGGFSTYITPTFNYSLKPEMVPEMFGELRLTIREIEQGWLKTAIISSVNDVSNKWEVDQIFNDRERFENEIIAECNKRVGTWFDVSLLRTNIIPPPSIQTAIEAQVKAVKETQAKEQQALVAIADGKKKVAVARADSAEAVINAAGLANAILIKAEAEAKAIKLKQAEITPQYNEYIRSQNWNGEYPGIMAGDGGGILLDARQQ